MTIVALQQPDPDPVTFDLFWELYPLHVAKLAARKAWHRVAPEQHMAILEALVWQRKVWAKDDFRYCPHAATYLNGERWTDEPTTVPGASHASFATAPTPGPATPRTAMPDSVRSLLAMIRGRR